MSFEWDYMLDVRPTWANKEQARNWEDSVRRNLTWIAKTASGRIVLNSIAFYRKWVPIYPYDEKLGSCNAYVGPNSAPSRDGRGYGATVFFSPHKFHRSSPCHGGAGNDRGSLPDEVLLHELVHAFRRVSGKRNRTETSGGLINYNSNEEFIAILITNIYVTDPTNRIKTGLRRDHKGFASLEPELASSFEFFESSMSAFSEVQQLVADHPGLTRALAKVPATFNPITAFLHDRAKAQRHSLSARALIRDAAGWGMAIRKSLGL